MMMGVPDYGQLVIGVAGPAGSGKDTIGNGLLEFGLVKSKRSFAIPLKAAVNAIYGWDDRHAFGDLKECRLPAYASTTHIYEVLFEHFGGQGFKAIDERAYDLAETWVNVCAERGALVQRDGVGGVNSFMLSPRQAYQWFGTELMRTHVDPEMWVKLAVNCQDNFVIPDVRFDNEVAAIRSFKRGLLIHVKRAGVAGVAPHVSEAGVQAKVGDVVLINDGTEADLKHAARVIGLTFAAGTLPSLSLTPTTYRASVLASEGVDIAIAV